MLSLGTVVVPNHTMSYVGATRHDTCITITHELSSAHLPQIASRHVNFERLTAGRLSYIPGIVKPGVVPWQNRGDYSGEFKRRR